MAVSPGDLAYRAEVTPESIKDLGRRLCDEWGVGPGAFGARGNLQHTRGYHRSRRYNRAHYPSDYSIQLAADKRGDENWISAFDFTPGVWGTTANRQQMIVITKRMRAAAKARDPRVRKVREFAGTEDGRTVVTIDMQTGGDRTPFDLSHLDHGHGSVFREFAADDHTGIFEVMAGIGDDMIDMDQPIPGIADLTVGQWMADVWEWVATVRGLGGPLDAEGLPTPRKSDRFKEPTAPRVLLAALRGLDGPPSAPVLSPEQLQALGDIVTRQIAATLAGDIEAAAERAVRRVLGTLDGATPPV
jgi:hypothetical protein